MCVITKVGIRQLRQNLSVYVERVKAGEAFEVTEYGRPVALLGPLPPAADVLQRLEREGQIRIAQRGAGGFRSLPPPLPAAADERSLSEILEEFREDRR